MQLVRAQIIHHVLCEGKMVNILVQTRSLCKFIRFGKDTKYEIIIS